MNKYIKITFTSIKICFLIFVFNGMLFCPIAFSQKLPSIQTNSLRAPSNIKVDGKADEWHNKFQAYNNHTEFYYIISNDDTNLYLTIQSTIPEITNRITNGGITFIINLADKKEDKGAKGIQYPIFEASVKGMMVLPVKTKKSNRNDNHFINVDSIMILKNERISAFEKYIKTYGLKNVDTLISVYNQDSIKTASFFDNKLVYTWEASISLNDLGINPIFTSKFAYHVKINATTESGINQPNRDSPDPLKRLKGIKVSNNVVVAQDVTDFWGEYTLAKKP